MNVVRWSPSAIRAGWRALDRHTERLRQTRERALASTGWPCLRARKSGWDQACQSQCSPRRRSCSAQDQGSARASVVRVRSAGTLSSSADTIRGETKASVANRRMCRSALPSRRAITAKPASRPCAKSSIHWRADRDQERLPAARFDRRVVSGHVKNALDSGWHWASPGNSNGRDAHDRMPVFPVAGIDFFRCLHDLAQPKLDMVRVQGHTLDMALEEVAISVGQLPPGAAGVKVIAQRCNNERLDLGSGNAADRAARPRMLLQHGLRDVIAVARASLV